ncbi:hypothetical protein F5B22DRAFT_229336 [Xylaria bambusicola]|uniref:uncharacterized protein n=1 Tax=Xylaria bambusicola TaxID=326684 RepID=UPI00200875E2|nr:uncharacterized protein F5B22DRAFT_229336 [Xylaria bambusicola]KAI0514485.1 hypothetical protein F5B22DRAFT_229336 [Xylaria bambusicola]
MGACRDKMLWCTYCGKAFTRKEHLERHLPSHTNVKPHRCEDCQLGFTRRDLLVRHHATYHTARDDSMGPTPGGHPPNAGKTQIACLNCAQAKTGCDKLLPTCTRCREKGLTCEVRYARRSTKAAFRNSQASRKQSVSLTAQHALPPSPLMMTTPITTPYIPAPMDGSQGPSLSDPQVKTPISPHTTSIMIDPRISQHGNLLDRSPQSNLQSRPDLPFSPLMPRVDDFVSYSNEFMGQDINYGTFDDMNYEMYSSNQYLADALMPALQDLSPIASSSSELVDSIIGSGPTRSTSIMSSKDVDQIMFDPNSPSDIPELETGALIASQSGWPIVRCNPVIYSGDCPRTAIIYLESLERKSKQKDTWNALEKYLSIARMDGTDLTSVVPINSYTRDHFLAKTQSFLHKALEIHRPPFHNHSSGFQNDDRPNPGSSMSLYLVLPPNKILEYFLRSYVRNLSCLYSLVPSGHVDPNEMILGNHATCLLVLLMVAQGASAVPSEEARTLSAGLIETCRISLFDIIEKNVEMCADLTINRCSLLFTLLGAWSGDKWLMDIAMGQRGMYISMLKHAGMFESPMSAPSPNPTNIEAAWRSWLDRETKNRLVYNWVMVDQELSLFHDGAPVITVSELCTPLPGPEQLWMSGNADQWMAAMQSNINCPPANASAQLLGAPLLEPTLFALFQEFLHNNSESQKWGALTPHRLRLLLHPLQSLLWYQRELKCYLPDTYKLRAMPSKSVDERPPMEHQADTQNLLQRWYKLSRNYFQAHPKCVVSKTNLVLFHLISLNVVTNFSAIEKLAQREDSAAKHGPYIHRIEETVYHCGQVVSLMRAIPVDRRPLWWSAALYRALLILWVYSILRGDASFLQNSETGIPLVIDKVAIDDEALYNYMWKEGPKAVPVLSGPSNSTVNLDNPLNVLNYAVKMIDEGNSSRFSDGIKRKLVELAKAWNKSSPPGTHQLLGI